MAYRLGKELRRLRRKKDVSLRTVERETGISNAYLSQLERGAAKNPTPHKLEVLAKYLDASYVSLLSIAGYLPSEQGAESMPLISTSQSDNLDRISDAVSGAELNSDEEGLVLHYIEFLKKQRTNES